MSFMNGTVNSENFPLRNVNGGKNENVEEFVDFGR